MKKVQISRRGLLGTTSATSLALAAMGGRRSSTFAQAGTAATPGASPVPDLPAVPEEFSIDTNWPAENYDLVATRDVRGSNVSTSTVSDLGTAWTYDVTSSGAFGSLTANPSIVGELIYIQDANANVYALNKETGKEIWVNTYDDTVPSGGPNGVAAAYGMLYTTSGGVGDVICLQQDTGEEIWRTNIRGPMGEGITTFPGVHDGIVWVSTIPGTTEDFYLGGLRGVIHALDAMTGEVIWYWDTTTDNLWGHPTVNSGGGFWHPPSFDNEGKAYVGIGNPGPYPGVVGWPWASSRPGPNLYTDSILKMDPDTATLDWYYQVLPHDVFDLDNQLTPILTEVDGRQVVFTSGKHGVVVCLDRANGEVIWRVEVGTHQNYDRTEFEEDEVVEVWPGTIGGVETQFAYSSEHNLLICPVVELPSTYIGTGFAPDAPFDFTQGTGLLTALNPSDGSIAWEVELATPPYAAATICNDVVFTAGLDGFILGFNVADGSEVFRYQASAGINAQAAASGDFIYFPAGGPLIASADSPEELPEPRQQVIALALGGEPQATPPPTGLTTEEVDATPPADSAITPPQATPVATPDDGQ